MAPTKSILLPSDKEVFLESCRKLINNRYTDSLLFTGCDAYDNKILLFLVRRRNTIQTHVFLKLASGQIYSAVQNHLSSGSEWHSKCVKVECCQPMGTWRISYNGLLKNAVSGEFDHVRMNFLWHPISSPVYADKSGQLLLEFHVIASMNEESVCNLLQGYEQWGTLHGTVAVNTQATELNLNSLKKRNWILYKKDAFMLTTYSKNGMLININSVINSCSGHARTLRKHFCISDCDFQYPLKIIPKMRFLMSDGKLWYRAEASVSLEAIVVSENLTMYNIVSCIEGVNGYGLLLSFKRFKKYENDKDLPIFPTLRPSSDMMINLESEECQNSAIVGEKAASLSKMIFSMRYFLKEEFSDNINIPGGVCLTTHAMDLFIRHNDDLKCSLNVLKYGLHELPNSQLKPLCEKMQKLWRLARMDVRIIELIEKHISHQKLYAVRSSGILEDTVDTSAAGLSSSFLAVQGVTNIVDAVKKCWASVYSFESVYYRRDHGLPLYVKLGVIIQEMVPIEIHGVLFTCHPISSDPRIISVTYSFGEHATLDNVPSVTVSVDKSDFSIIETVYNSMGIGNRERRSLPPELFQTLCKISLRLEDLFSYPVDVEWVINEEKIHLLQCRPITTTFTWTDFEIRHELDSGFTDFDAITFHNCGEIVSDATSPLSITFNNRIMEEAFQLVEKNPSTTYHKKLLSVTQYRIAMNICNGLLLQVNREIPFLQKIIDVIVCGQVITTETLYQLAQKRNGITSSISSIVKLISSIKLVMDKNKFTEEAIKIASQFTINADEFNSAELLLERIIDEAAVLQKVAEYHLNVSSASNILKAGVLSLMCGDDEESLQSHVTNLSWYLSNCDELVSAGVPKSLLEIAELLRNHENKTDYLLVPTRYKCDWMQKNCPQAWIKTKIFFEKHGARCVKEADLMTEPWSLDSDPIFECIDSLVKCDKLQIPCNLVEYKRQENIASGQNYGRRVKWMLGSCRNAVVSREKTKQCFILALHQFRLAFRRLSTLLAEDLVISNSKFVFFYTMYELYQLVKGTNRRSILHKGQRRYRLWSQLRNLKFDDVIFGLPRPTTTEPEPIVDEVFRLRGTSVSFHSALGRARVVRSIEEAKNLESGDILVMHCVDIGWSPYFPLLSGLITELGGLMSHGAIIARECGLPCVIGVKDATIHIKTGDTIEINGPTGTITRLKSNQ